MSSIRSAQRLQIECHGYRRLRFLFVGCILSATGCLLIVPLSWPQILFSILLLALLALRSWRSRCELGGDPVALLWDSEGRWWWRQKGEESELSLAGDSYLSTWMIVLNLYDPLSGKKRAMLVFPSGSGEALFRCLSVRLKLEARFAQTGTGLADMP